MGITWPFFIQFWRSFLTVCFFETNRLLTRTKRNLFWFCFSGYVLCECFKNCNIRYIVIFVTKIKLSYWQNFSLYPTFQMTVQKMKMPRHPPPRAAPKKSESSQLSDDLFILVPVTTNQIKLITQVLIPNPCLLNTKETISELPIWLYLYPRSSTTQLTTSLWNIIVPLVHLKWWPNLKYQ